mgnify:FL=1
MSNEEVLLARQPIYDKKLNIVAYELLFRGTNLDHANVTDGDYATSRVLTNAFENLNIDEVVGEQKAYINFTRNIILSPPPFDPEKYVVEVLEDITPDAEVLEALTTLKKKGYTIALDDFIFHEELAPLVALAEIIKVDLTLLSKDELESEVEKLKEYNVTLLAEKIETYDEFEHCKSLGFELFQGYFLAKPQLVTGQKIEPSKKVLLKLLSQLQNSDIDFDEVENLILEDPTVSLKLLKLVNSAAYKRARTIDSIQQAITFLGVNKIKSWGTLLAMVAAGEKPIALRLLSVIRARMCQLLCAFFDENQSEKYFTLGLLSTLDAYFDQPFETLIADLPINDEMKAALIQREGFMGAILDACIKHERGDWDNIQWDVLEQKGINKESFELAYIGAINWASEHKSEL